MASAWNPAPPCQTATAPGGAPTAFTRSRPPSASISATPPARRRGPAGAAAKSANFTVAEPAFSVMTWVMPPASTAGGEGQEIALLSAPPGHQQIQRNGPGHRLIARAVRVQLIARATHRAVGHHLRP